MKRLYGAHTRVNAGADERTAPDRGLPGAESDRTAIDNHRATEPPRVRKTGTGSSRDIIAESLADVVIDPALLAAMVTTAPTLLTPATAAEPEAGMPSVAAIDGGTAIIVTAPTRVGAGTATAADALSGDANAALATAADATAGQGTTVAAASSQAAGSQAAGSQAAIAESALARASSNPSANGDTRATSASSQTLIPSENPGALGSPGASGAAGIPGSSTPAGAPTPGLSALGLSALGTSALGTSGTPVESGASATAGAAQAGTAQTGTAQAGTTQAGTTQAGTAQASSAQAGTAQAGSAQLAAALASSATMVPAPGTDVNTETVGSAALSGSATATPIGADVGSTASSIIAANSPNAGQTTSPSVVNPIAVALAGAYGTARPGSSDDRAAGPIPTGLAGVSDAGSIGSSPPLVSGTNPANSPDSGQNLDPDGSGAQAPVTPNNVQTAATPSAYAMAAAATGQGIGTGQGKGTGQGVGEGTESATPGLPLTGITGVNSGAGITGTTPTTAAQGTDPGERAAATAGITDQVMAQIGRQLQGVRLLRDGTHHTVLRLSPEQLGDVTITLDVRAGGIRLDLAAGSQALVALQADLGQLRDNLANSGLDLGAVTLSSRDAGMGADGQATARERWQEPAPTRRESTGDGTASPTTSPDRARSWASRRPGDGGLDVLA
jgi:hypothetical protein